MMASAEVQRERERCLRCVECHLANARDNLFTVRLLTRIANQIRAGTEATSPLGRIDDEDGKNE